MPYYAVTSEGYDVVEGMLKPRLTPLQRDVLGFIYDREEEFRRATCIYDISREFRFEEPRRLASALDELLRRGYIRVVKSGEEGFEW